MTKEYLDLAINYFQDEDGVFTAVVPAIKGCVSSGKTLNEAYENAKIAIESCLEARAIIEDNLKIKNDYQSINLFKVNKELSYA